MSLILMSQVRSFDTFGICVGLFSAHIYNGRLVLKIQSVKIRIAAQRKKRSPQRVKCRVRSVTEISFCSLIKQLGPFPNHHWGVTLQRYMRFFTKQNEVLKRQDLRTNKEAGW